VAWLAARHSRTRTALGPEPSACNHAPNEAAAQRAGVGSLVGKVVYFTAENGVGLKMKFFAFAMVGPFAMIFARPAS
jgi:hypothetical protein